MSKASDTTTFYSALARDYGSPLYVYDFDKVVKRISELKDILPNDSVIYYSLKSNPLPSLSKVAVENNCHMEVTSSNELNVAIGTGINPEHILFSGPGKTESEIRESLNANITQFSAESWTDLKRIDSMAQEFKINVSILLRVNPDQSLQSGLSMSGSPTQFGFEEADLIDNWSQLDELSKYSLVHGFHIYYGSQLADTKTLAQSFQLGIECVEKICAKHNFYPKVLDLGGGFPWSYAKPQDTSTILDLKENIIDALAIRYFSKNAELRFESGRYISASSGTLVSKVLAVKQSKRQSRFVILDAGINHLGGMSGLGRILRNYACIVSMQDRQHNSSDDNDLIETNVVGPLCSPLDCMSSKADLPVNIQPGDLIMVPNVGAYGLTASLVAFLTKPPPIEIAVKDGKILAVHQLQSGHKTLEF